MRPASVGPTLLSKRTCSAIRLPFPTAQGAPLGAHYYQTDADPVAVGFDITTEGEGRVASVVGSLGRLLPD